jgi:signal peptidase II
MQVPKMRDPMRDRQPDRRGILFFLALAVFAADRVSKWWVEHHIVPGGGRTIIPRVFRLSHVMNNGAAFSMFSGGDQQSVRWMLIGVSSVAVVLMLGLLSIFGRRATMNTTAFALILGGAAGNLLDRIQLGEVVDFLEVHIAGYHYPDFNLADSAIVIGGALIFIASFRLDKAEKEKAKGDPLLRARD